MLKRKEFENDLIKSFKEIIKIDSLFSIFD